MTFFDAGCDGSCFESAMKRNVPVRRYRSSGLINVPLGWMLPASLRGIDTGLPLDSPQAAKGFYCTNLRVPAGG